MLRLPPQLIRYRRGIVLCLHLLLVVGSLAGAYALRFDFDVPAQYRAGFWAVLPYLLVIRLAVFDRMGVDRGYWRHVGLRDLVAIVASVTVGSVLFVAALFIVGNLNAVPRAVLILDWLLAISLCGGIRFAARCVREGNLPLRLAKGQRTLVVGAGAAGERLVRQCLHDDDNNLHFVGLVDDDEATHGMSIHGVPVLGPIADIAAVAASHRVELIVIALASASGEQLRRVIERCAEANVPFKIVPTLREMLDGRAQLSQLRDVEIDDLLGRAPVELDLDQVEHDLSGKVVLVTGGAGSIGSELSRQIAGFSPRQMLVLDQAESPLYFVHLELQHNHPELCVIPIIADITDAERMEQVFSEYRPDYVFHAAAYKHVPMMERNVVEAVRNNVAGTLRVADCAMRYGARKFVLISTDKAVNPSSVMGATKRVAERLVLGFPSLRASNTDFRAVRFGNVLGSDGSVIPLFKRQLAAGGPITVTHPKVRRYFMTIPEAVQLVLQAAAAPEACRRISMLDMGEPVRIVELAEQLIRLSGLEPYKDVSLVFTGLRPGEKLDEELMSTVEATLPTTLEKIRIVETDEVQGAALERGIRRLSAALLLGDQAALLRELQLLVPEYRTFGADSEKALTPALEKSRVPSSADWEQGVRGAVDLAFRPTPDRSSRVSA